MKFQEYLDKKYQTTESKSNETEIVNEYSGDQASEVSFGVFSWGGGGEIDAMAAAVGAAGLLAMKSLYNGIVYAKLKGQLPAYIKEYKITQAPKSNIVWKEGKMGDKVREIEKQINSLTGQGGTREDDRDAGKGEKSAKEKADAALKPAIEKAKGPKKQQLKDKLDKVHQQIDVKIQQLRDKKQAAEDKLDADWDKAKEKFRQYDERFKKSQDGFLEVRDSPLASAFRKKWDREFQVAKNQANIEVLEEAQKLARENKMERELDAINGALERAKASQKEAEEKLNQVLDDADKAEAKQAKEGELGIKEYMKAAQALDAKMKELTNKWKQEVESGASGGRDKEAAIRVKIKKAEDKLKKGQEALTKIKDSGDQEKAAKIEDALKKIEGDIASYKEELEKVRESLDNSTYFTLAIQIDETIEMLDALFEKHEDLEEKENATNFTAVKHAMDRAISNASKDQAAQVATDCLKDINALKAVAEEFVKARNNMVEKVDAAVDNGESLGQWKGITKLVHIDDKKYMSKFENAIKDLEEKGAKAEEKEDRREEQEAGQGQDDNQGTTPEETPEETAPEEDTEEIKKLKQDIEDQKDRIEAIKKKSKDAKSPLSNKDVLKKALEPEEEKLRDLEDKLDKAKGGKKEESVQSNFTPRYMKFEDFLASKQKK